MNEFVEAASIQEGMTDDGSREKYVDVKSVGQFTEKKIESLAHHFKIHEDIGKHWSFEKIRQVLAMHIERCEPFVFYDKGGPVEGWSYFLRNSGRQVPRQFSKTQGALYQYLTYDLGVFPIATVLEKKRKRATVDSPSEQINASPKNACPKNASPKNASPKMTTARETHLLTLLHLERAEKDRRGMIIDELRSELAKKDARHLSDLVCLTNFIMSWRR